MDPAVVFDRRQLLRLAWRDDQRNRPAIDPVDLRRCDQSFDDTGARFGPHTHKNIDAVAGGQWI
jgi:hypothetical protein